MLWNVLSLFVYFVSQCLHPSTHPYIWWIFLEVFKFLVSALFCYAMPPTHLWLIRHPCTCTGKWHPTANALCPLRSFPQKSAGCKSSLHSKLSTKAPPTENSLVTGGSFKCNTYLITVLDWLKKERRKKEDERF